MYQFFVQPEQIQGKTIRITGNDVNHIKNVLRMKPGEEISVSNGVDGKEYRMTCVSMGNPHAVIFSDGVEEMDLEKIGPSFENHERFPRRINTEFVEIRDRGRVRMRVWERGTGETLACGTGCCATAVAGVLNGLTDRKVTVEVTGGELLIEWDEQTNHVFMTGPARFVFEGTVEWEKGTPGL